jgi:hypothetical protein
MPVVWQRDRTTLKQGCVKTKLEFIIGVWRVCYNEY